MSDDQIPTEYGRAPIQKAFKIKLKEDPLFSRREVMEIISEVSNNLNELIASRPEHSEISRISISLIDSTNPPEGYEHLKGGVCIWCHAQGWMTDKVNKDKI